MASCLCNRTNKKMVSMRVKPTRRLYNALRIVLCYGSSDGTMPSGVSTILGLFKMVLEQYDQSEDLTEKMELCLVLRHYITDFLKEFEDLSGTNVTFNGKEYNVLYIVLWDKFVKTAFADCPFQGDMERFMTAKLPAEYGWND